MTNTVRYLDAMKARYDGASDYRVAKILGVTQQTVSNWRREKDSFSPGTAKKVADELHIDPAVVVIAAQIDRAKTPEEKAVWESILKKCGGLSAALVLALGLVGSPPPAQAAPGQCVLCKPRLFRRIRVNLASFAEFFRVRGEHRYFSHLL